MNEMSAKQHTRLSLSLAILDLVSALNTAGHVVGMLRTMCMCHCNVRVRHVGRAYAISVSELKFDEIYC